MPTINTGGAFILRGLRTPEMPQDAATMDYVDNAVPNLPDFDRTEFAVTDASVLVYTHPTGDFPADSVVYLCGLVADTDDYTISGATLTFDAGVLRVGDDITVFNALTALGDATATPTADLRSALAEDPTASTGGQLSTPDAVALSAILQRAATAPLLFATSQAEFDALPKEANGSPSGSIGQVLFIEGLYTDVVPFGANTRLGAQAVPPMTDLITHVGGAAIAIDGSTILGIPGDAAQFVGDNPLDGYYNIQINADRETAAGGTTDFTDLLTAGQLCWFRATGAANNVEPYWWPLGYPIDSTGNANQRRIRIRAADATGTNIRVARSSDQVGFGHFSFHTGTYTHNGTNFVRSSQ